MYGGTGKQKQKSKYGDLMDKKHQWKKKMMNRKHHCMKEMMNRKKLIKPNRTRPVHTLSQNKVQNK